MQKGNQTKVTEYQFKDLKGIPLDESISNYSFQDISNLNPVEVKRHKETIKEERTHAELSNFKIAPIVREHRGMIEQEEAEKQNQIENEVNRRLLVLEEEAYRKGFEQGQKDGREEVFVETQAATDEKIQALNEMISDVLTTKEEMLKEERLQVYDTIKTLTKWIILRELGEDGKYIERLLEKLILEMQMKSNLLIHVNQSAFDGMPEVLNRVQERLGELTNVRIELGSDTTLPGLVLQSENGILNGKLAVQFKNLDKLFSNVGLPFDDSSEEKIILDEASEEVKVKENLDEPIEILDASDLDENAIDEMLKETKSQTNDDEEESNE